MNARGSTPEERLLAVVLGMRIGMGIWCVLLALALGVAVWLRMVGVQPRLLPLAGPLSLPTVPLLVAAAVIVPAVLQRKWRRQIADDVWPGQPGPEGGATPPEPLVNRWLRLYIKIQFIRIMLIFVIAFHQLAVYCTFGGPFAWAYRVCSSSSAASSRHAPRASASTGG